MQRSKLPPDCAARFDEYGLSGLDLSGAALMSYARGEWFLNEGREITYLLILLSGKAKVCVNARNGRSLLLCYYISEGIVGDLELMTGSRLASTSMQAVTPLRCIALPLERYAPILRAHLPFVLRAGEELAGKLEARVQSSTEAILRPFEARLCDYLLQTAQDGVCSERLTDVAELLGCSYRHLLRCLGQLCRGGLLEKLPRGYRVLDPAALSARAEG